MEPSNEVLLKDKAKRMMEIIKQLDNLPISIDNNAQMKADLLMCGEILAMSVTENKPVVNSILDRTVRENKKIRSR